MCGIYANYLEKTLFVLEGKEFRVRCLVAAG